MLIFIFGGYFLFKTKIFSVRHWRLFLKSLTFKGEGEDSPLKSLGVALAGTLGVGNIVGVVGAVSLGGAGALFWLWVSSFFSMMLKYAETVLAMKQRKKDEMGMHGGGMYYITPKSLSVFFTLLCLVCSFLLGGAIQSDAVYECVNTVFGIDGNIICAIMAVLCFAVIYGGKKGIFNFASRLVPFMSILYILMCFAVIACGYQRIPEVFLQIFKSAFNVKAVAGGGLFAAVKYGVMRGLISNEAGCGTAPIAHSASDNPSPAAQGCLGIAEVFIDTVVLCTLTGLTVLLYPTKKEGMGAVLHALGSVFGDLSSYLLTLCIILFAFATQICWAYYGHECIYYLFKGSRVAEFIYKVIFSLSVFALRFAGGNILWYSADLIIALMALINMTAVFKNRGEIIKETRMLFK